MSRQTAREPTRAAFAIKDTREFLGDFNPETSTREKRKLNRANIYNTNATKALHDRDGKMIGDGSDFCDCLEPECPGCHFPCLKCGSQKCSVDCRKNRKWTPDIIELEGTNKILTLEAALKALKEKETSEHQSSDSTTADNS